MTRCPLLPTADRFVLVADAPVQAGLIFVVTAKQSDRGTVVAVGPDCNELQVGDRVVHKTLKATIVEVGDTKWSLLREEDVLCWLGDGKPFRMWTPSELLAAK